MAYLLDVLFGCSHKNYTFPITIRGRSGASASRTYVVCLDCGKEFAYDWKEMKIIANPRPAHDAGAIGESAAYATK